MCMCMAINAKKLYLDDATSLNTQNKFFIHLAHRYMLEEIIPCTNLDSLETGVFLKPLLCMIALSALTGAHLCEHAIISRLLLCWSLVSPQRSLARVVSSHLDRAPGWTNNNNTHYTPHSFSIPDPLSSRCSGTGTEISSRETRKVTLKTYQHPLEFKNK